MNGRGQSGKLGTDGRITSRWTLNEQDVDQNHLTQNMVQWWAFVNTILNLQVPKRLRIYCLYKPRRNMETIV
jgi:hypothetical protein